MSLSVLASQPMAHIPHVASWRSVDAVAPAITSICIPGSRNKGPVRNELFSAAFLNAPSTFPKILLNAVLWPHLADDTLA